MSSAVYGGLGDSGGTSRQQHYQTAGRSSSLQPSPPTAMPSRPTRTTSDQRPARPAVQIPKEDSQHSLYGDDIIAAYETLQDSPTREREQRKTPATSTKTSPTVAKTNSASTTAAPAKKDGPYDLIDRLDISGLYGGGSIHRHDGPYAAATASRNKGPQAPMAAFDPSALAPPGSAAQRSSRSNGLGASGSARAGPATSALDPSLALHGDSSGTYPSSAMPGAAQVSMGFPTQQQNQNKNKGLQLAEIYGVGDNEAWEDFGVSKFATNGAHSGSSKENMTRTPFVSKEDRMDRTQSIWDMEATIKSGKPVGVGKTPPPPMPVLPVGMTVNNSPESLLSASTSASGNKPKRSKSLVARFKGGRRSNANGDPDSATESPSASPIEARTSPFANLAPPRPSAERSNTAPLDKALRDPDASEVLHVSRPRIETRSRSYSYKDQERSPVQQLSMSSGYSSEYRQQPNETETPPALGRKTSVMRSIFGKKGRA